MAISVTLSDAQFQMAAGGTSVHTLTNASHVWATGDQLLVCEVFHNNAVADRSITGLTASSGTLSTPVLSNVSMFVPSGTTYHLDGAVGFSSFTAGATATLSATDDGDASDMWLTGCVLKLSGVDPVTPIRQTVVAGTSSGGSATVSPNLGSAPLSDSLLVAICVANNNSAWTVPSGWTETHLAETTWGGYHSTMWKNGSNTQSNSFTAASAVGLAVIVFEVAAAAVGGATFIPAAFHQGQRFAQGYRGVM